MIISHKYKVIFIKTTKTAGSSFELVFRKYCDSNDVVIPIKRHEDLAQKMGLVGKSNARIPFSKYNIDDWYALVTRFKLKEFREHSTAQEVKEGIDPKVWNTYFKFCVERNPIEKVKSRYYWTGVKTGLSLNDYILQEAEKDSDFDRYSHNNKILVDQVFKYEEMDTWLPWLEQKLDLPGPVDMKSLKLKSGFRPKQKQDETISPQALEKIKKAYAKEIMHFYPEILDIKVG